MSISAPFQATDPDATGARWRRPVVAAAAVAGAAFVAEAVVSVVADSHVGYHALSTVLNAALLVASAGFARAGRAVVGRAGVGGGWATAVMAALALVGGVWVLLAEGLRGTEPPGVMEGVAHTAVLASLLFLVPLGSGLRRVGRVAGYVIAGSSACLVTMVLAGLDQPEAFLGPEAVLGLGWLLLARTLLPATATPATVRANRDTRWAFGKAATSLSRAVTQSTPGGAKNSNAMPSGSRKETPEP